MTLYEMSFAYEGSERLLAERIQKLRAELSRAGREEERLQLRRRIAALEPLRREMRQLTTLTRCYYERKARDGKTSELF